MSICVKLCEIHGQSEHEGFIEMSMDVTQFVHVRSKSYFIIKHEGGSDSYQDEVTFDLKEQGHYVVSVSADFIKFLSFCPTEY